MDTPKELVEKVARRLCAADGFAPDDAVLLWKTPKIGAKGHIMVPPTDGLIPQWKLYVPEVFAALRCLRDEGLLVNNLYVRLTTPSTERPVDLAD